MKNTFKKISKILALAAVFALSLSLLASCGGIDEKAVIMQADGKYDISYELYRYFYLNYKYGMEDDAFSDENIEETKKELERLTVSSLQGVFATIAVAGSYNIKLDDPDIVETVDLTVEETKEDMGGSAEYKQLLEDYYMTEDVFRFMIAVDACEDVLYSTLTTGLGIIETDNEKVLEIIKGDEFIRIQQVMISKTNGFTDEENKEKANTVYTLATSGTPFRDLVAKYSNDYSMTDDGYYFTYMYMNEEIEKAAFALDIGEISPVIESSGGYHIILRLEKEEDYIMQNFEDLKTQYQSCRFYTVLDEKKPEISIEKTELFDSIAYEDIKY